MRQMSGQEYARRFVYLFQKAEPILQEQETSYPFARKQGHFMHQKEKKYTGDSSFQPQNPDSAQARPRGRPREPREPHAPRAPKPKDPCREAGTLPRNPPPPRLGFAYRQNTWAVHTKRDTTRRLLKAGEREERYTHTETAAEKPTA